MPVVVWSEDGRYREKRREEFDNEHLAAIFMDGIRARDDLYFHGIEYPDEARLDPPDTGRKPRL